MRLQTRMSIAYGYLTALVLAGAAGSALGFHSLAGRIGGVLEGNQSILRASMRMLETLERQDSAVLAALLDPSRSGSGLERSEREFLEALAQARMAGSAEPEVGLLRAIEDRYETYRDARDRLLTRVPTGALEAYERDCFPAFEDVKTGVRDLLELHHDAMLRSDRAVKAAAGERALGFAALTAIAIVSAGFLSRGIRRNVIDRIEDLRAVTEAVGRGDLQRRADERPGDELGLVSRGLNRLLDANDELRGRSSVRLAEARDLIVGLIGSGSEPAAAVNLGGEIVASSLEDDATRGVSQAADRLAGIEPNVETAVIEGAGVRFACRRLRTTGGRAVGWLVRPRADNAVDQTPD